MKKVPAFLLTIGALLCSAEAAPPKKKTPAPKPQPTVKDMAIAEARKCDGNHDGKISGPEVSVLRAVWPTNPKSWLYLFDDNGNNRLDDQEVAAIEFKPSPKPGAPNASKGGKPRKPKK